MSLLTVENLFLRYPGQARAAVDGVTFSVARGEIFALLGPSGSGKTTTLRLIAGFERSERGRIVLDGRMIEGNGGFVAPERRNVGFVWRAKKEVWGTKLFDSEMRTPGSELTSRYQTMIPPASQVVFTVRTTF